MQSKEQEDLKDKEGNFSLLDETIEKTKENDKLAYSIHGALSMKIKPEFYENKKLRVHLPLPIEYVQVKNLKIHNISPESQLYCRS
ncbi:MAG: hypothetical protein GX046_08495 [Tissierellia bacterium]|nr:hypothetical protein [Tissierellia bacterium]